MKLNRIILLILGFIFTINIVFAGTYNNPSFANWYEATNTFDDIVGNYSATTNNGTLNTSGIIGDGRSLANTTLITAPITYSQNKFTIAFWVYLKTSGQPQYILATNRTGAGIWLQRCSYNFLSANQIDCRFTNASATTAVTGGAISLNSWTHIVWTYNGSNMSLYVNGTRPTSGSSANGFVNIIGNVSPYIIGNRGDGSNPNFNYDEYYMWLNDYLNETEVLALFNANKNGSHEPNLNPILIFTNINLTNNTLTNQSSLGIGLNISTINTNTNINTTMYLSNGSSYRVGTNTQNVSYNLTNIKQGVYNIWFNASNNETSVTSSNYTYTFDYGQPNLTNNIPSQIYVYTLNLTSNITYSDSVGIAYCYFNVSNGQNSICNSTSIFTFNVSGNFTYNITVRDTTGNVNTANGTIYVNPYQYFRFFDLINGIYLSSYTFGPYSSIGNYVQIPLYDYGLGSHSLEFDKGGFAPTNFTFTISNLSGTLNQTFNISPAGVSIKVYDEETGVQIPFNLTMINSTSSTIFLNNINFTGYYNQTIHGDTSLIFESSSNGTTYALRKLFLFITENTTSNITMYLLKNTSATPIIWETKDVSGSTQVENATLNFYRYINGTRTFVGQARTDSLGFTYFYLNINYEYQVIVTKDGYITQVFSTIPSQTSYPPILLYAVGSQVSFLFSTFSYQLYPPVQYIYTLPFTAAGFVLDEDNSITSMTFTVTGPNFTYTNTSTNANGANLTLNITNTTARYLLNLTVIRDGQTYTFTKYINYLNSSNSVADVVTAAENLQGEENNADRIFVILILYCMAVVMGIGVSGNSVGGAGVGLFAIWTFAYVGWFSTDVLQNYGVAVTISLITIFGGWYFRN